MRIRILLPLALLFTLLAPTAIAVACSIAVAPPARPHIAPADLRFVFRAEAPQEAWVRGDGWISSRVGLSESIQPRFARRPIAAAYAQQRSLKLMAIRPIDGEYGDDSDPATPPCGLTGRRVYSATRLLVRETASTIQIVLASHRTPGSTEGCRTFSTSCDDLVMRTVSLDAPIGTRRVTSVTF